MHLLHCIFIMKLVPIRANTAIVGIVHSFIQIQADSTEGSILIIVWKSIWQTFCLSVTNYYIHHRNIVYSIFYLLSREYTWRARLRCHICLGMHASSSFKKFFRLHATSRIPLAPPSFKARLSIHKFGLTNRLSSCICYIIGTQCSEKFVLSHGDPSELS